jgi:hypothetical protein
MDKWLVYKKYFNGEKEDIGIIETEKGLSNAGAWYHACLSYVSYPWIVENFSLHVKRI